MSHNIEIIHITLETRTSFLRIINYLFDDKNMKWSAETEMREDLYNFLIEKDYEIMPPKYNRTEENEDLVNYNFTKADLYAYKNKTIYVFELKLKLFDRGIGQLLKYAEDTRLDSILGNKNAVFYESYNSYLHIKKSINIENIEFYLVVPYEDKTIEKIIEKYKLPINIMIFSGFSSTF